MVLLITKLRGVSVLQGISSDQCSEVSTGETLKCVGGACLNLEKTYKVRKLQKGFGDLGLGALMKTNGFTHNPFAGIVTRTSSPVIREALEQTLASQ
ncbi:MAG: hypothetical protein CME17_09370 [Gemmatimonadetes bacterium]|nr:hypothetical protein [Gemmatimonadota bacterium]